MERFWERLKRAARLGGIVALAGANLALTYCSHSKSTPDGTPADLQQPADAPSADSTRDAGPPDAAADAAPADSGPAKPDAKLWDVLCE